MERESKSPTIMVQEELRTTICKKIDDLLADINSYSTRDADLKVAQTAQALSEVYKNLGVR